MHHAFLYISLPSLRDYDGKMPNFTFHRGRNQPTAKFSFSFWTWMWFLRIRLKKRALAFDKLTSSSDHDRDWQNANSLFKRRFRGRRRRGILNSLLQQLQLSHRNWTFRQEFKAERERNTIWLQRELRPILVFVILSFLFLRRWSISHSYEGVFLNFTVRNASVDPLLRKKRSKN